MTKEQIQTEYNQLMPVFGEKAYRLVAPLIELLSMGQRILFLNQSAAKIPKDAECQTPELKAVPESKS